MTWHPRDLDTWVSLDQQEAQVAEERAAEARFAAARAEMNKQLGRG